jgi:periplasmic divalent cation tolerance protein
VSDELCEVVITAPDADWLVAFTRGLVEDRLAASAQTVTEVRSVYEWRGELVERTEARAAVRTRTSLVPAIVERLDQEHPYEVPGIVAVPIIATNPGYGDWLLAQTATLPPTA